MIRVLVLLILAVTKIKNVIDAASDEEVVVKATERRFRALADSIPLIVWTANPNGEVDYYNKQWEIYTGFTAEETKRSGWIPVLHPDDLPCCIKKWEKAFTSGKLFEIEYRLKRATDGAYRWHLGKVIPFRDDSGTIIKWFGTSTDIDDQRRAKESVNQASLEIENIVKQRTAELLIKTQDLIRQNEIKESAIEILQSDSIRLNEIITTQDMLAKAELDLDAFIALVVERMARLTAADGVCVEMVARDEMVYRAAAGALAPHIGLPLKMDNSLSGLCVQSRQVLAAEDTEIDPRVDVEACRKIKARSMVVAPLFCAGRPVGVLKIIGHTPHAFRKRDIQTLQLMAGLIGAAIGHQADYEVNRRLLAERTEAIEALLQEIDRRILVEQTVSANELRTHKIIESSYDAFVAIDAKGVIIDWNQQAETLFGWRRSEAIGAVLAELVIPERFREAHATGMERYIVSGASTVLNKRVELVGLRRTGEEFPIELTIKALQYNEKNGYEFCAFLRDITDRKIAEERLLYLEKARAEITLNSISDAVIGTDMSGNVDYLNVAAENMTGWSREEACGKPIGEVMQIINGTTGKTERNPVEWVLQQNQPMGLNADCLLVRRDGSRMPIEDSAAPIRDADGKISGVVLVFHDITAAQAMTMKMAHLAQHDFLTNLPNRLLLNDRITQAIVLAERRGTQVAVLFLDLDNFKHINDSLGHAIGDQLLQSVALRLSACVRSSDTVSRQGGDEFVVLVTEDKNAENAALTADKILTALAAPHIIDEHELHVTTSIGISVYPSDGQNAETLIKNADTAMYQAKAKGRNNYQFFKSDMNVRAVERQVIESHLRHALARQEFVLHYQPKVNLESGTITGAEALLRWLHPEWGMVLPDHFVPIAEDCGLIVPIGRWVLREACMQAKRWEGAVLNPISVAVNISALEFRRKDFVDVVGAILRETGLAPSCLQLEITESALMRDAESSTAILQQFKTMGVQLAVDDFGTGYSSLSYLNRFPIDVLKIDQSFVHAVGSTPDDGVIVSAVIAMGNSLKQQVVAEGVEDAVQLAFLKKQNCEEGQGYFFSRPLSADEFAGLLATGIADIQGINCPSQGLNHRL